MLTWKTWKMGSFKVNRVEAIEDCQKDNTIVFAATCLYTEDYGAILCDRSEEQWICSWFLSADGN
jgi:hypothetical protein